MFTSTRGLVAPLSFEEAVLAGWAPDGGMLLPSEASVQSIRQRMPALLCEWHSAELGFESVVAEVLLLFTGDSLTREVVNDIVKRSLAEGNFDCSEVVPFRPGVKISHDEDSPSIEVCELWHGPTLAFKDIGLQVLCSLLAFFLSRGSGSSRQTLLVGTSGDTGSAAIEAVVNAVCEKGASSSLDIVCLYPVGGRCSPVQERQMLLPAVISKARDAAAAGTGVVHLIGVDGTSDDLDVPMEAVFNDCPFKKKHSVGTVNSVNIVRLIVQSAFFVHAYLHKLRQSGKAVGSDRLPPLAFAVPTGAAGHVSSGLLAKAMGVPISALVVGTNSNDTLCKFLLQGSSGSPLRVSSLGTVRTAAPSMDISVPYNLERMLSLSGYDLDTPLSVSAQAAAASTARAQPSTAVGNHAAAVKRIMLKMKQVGAEVAAKGAGTGKARPVWVDVLTLADEADLAAARGCARRLRQLGVCCPLSGGASDEQIKITMRSAFDCSLPGLDRGEPCLIDPHTACGVHAAFALISNRDGDADALAAIDEALCVGGLGCVAMACAHPLKFPNACADALGGTAEQEAEAAEALAAEARAHRSVRKCERMRYTNAEVPVHEQQADKLAAKLPLASPVTRSEVEKACVAFLSADKKGEWEGQVRAVIESVSRIRRGNVDV